MGDINCPYCGTEQEICHDDGYGYEENTKHNQECGNCGKRFVFTTEISFYYEAEEAACLNDDGEHVWTPTKTHPIEYTEMQCAICEERRTPTKDEMSVIVAKQNH